MLLPLWEPPAPAAREPAALTPASGTPPAAASLAGGAPGGQWHVELAKALLYRLGQAYNMDALHRTKRKAYNAEMLQVGAAGWRRCCRGLLAAQSLPLEPHRP